MERYLNKNQSRRIVNATTIKYAALAIIAILCIMVGFSSTYVVYLASLIAIYTIMVMSLNLIQGYTGQISLGHGALMVSGTYAAIIMVNKFQTSFGINCLIAIVVACLVGIIMCIPSLRLRSMYLAIATLAFNLVITNMAITFDKLTGGQDGIGNVPSASFGPLIFNNIGYFYLLVVVVAILFWLMSNLVTSRDGRAFKAIREDSLAAQCMGIDVTRYKFTSFLISASIAGLGGGLMAYFTRYVCPTMGDMWFSIFLIMGLIIGGKGTMIGPVIAAAVLVLLSEYTQYLGDSRMIVYGLLCLLCPLLMPKGITGFIDIIWAKIKPGSAKRTANEIVDVRLSDITTPLPFNIHQNPGNILELNKVNKDFGGLRAVDQVSMQVKAGNIHSLIGPNGSGKTTILNLITGVYKVDSGHVYLNSAEITSLHPHVINKMGISRTFQNIRIFHDLSVLENVLIGQHHTLRGNIFSGSLKLPLEKKEEKKAIEFATGLCSFLGLADKMYLMAKDLPFTLQRRLEIARALASRPRLLLLDEPASGLSPSEMLDLNDLILKIRDAGITILLIEHHMDVVMGISDRITVLDFGKLIMEGLPDEVQCDERVLEAYLGKE